MKSSLYAIGLVMALFCGSSWAYIETPSHSAQVEPVPKRPLYKRVFRSKWAGVDPVLRQRLEPVLKQLKDEGYDVRLVEGRRSFKRQAQLLESGKGVTTVGAGRSCHNWGLAVDSVVFVNGKPSWDLNNPHVAQGFARYGVLAKQAGLVWGGDWKDPVDMPHVELRSDCLVAVRQQKRLKRDRDTMLAYEPHEDDAETFALAPDNDRIEVAFLPEDPAVPRSYDRCLLEGWCLFGSFATPWAFNPPMLTVPVVSTSPVIPAVLSCSSSPWDLASTHAWEVS